MVEKAPLQEILGVDKKNPLFTLCKTPQQPGKLLVFFGACLLEVLDDDPQNPALKLLLARLYNAGVSPKALLEAFPFSYTTLRRLGDALKSGNVERLLSVLAGRQHPRKLRDEILSFAQTRFDAVYPENTYTYSKVIRKEILDAYDVDISGESLRPYFNEWKKRFVTPPVTPIETPERHTSSIVDDGVNPSVEEMISPASETSEAKSNPVLGQVPAEAPSTKGSEVEIRKHAVDLKKQAAVMPPASPNTAYQFCHHAGVLLFSGFLSQLTDQLGMGTQLIKQWLTVTLLGALNIEQTKLLNYPSLKRFIGTTLANLNQQRQHLTALAQTTCVDELLRLNGQWVNIDQCSDFHYDPHSKHYTGANTLLKGWCSRRRFAEKILHMDFIHTSTGQPVYLSHDDNYQDLRERFFDVVSQFRQLFGFADSKPLTFILDRGIYGIDTFKKFLTGTVTNHFITWEKGFDSEEFIKTQWPGSMVLCRQKNSSCSLLYYRFEYCDARWSRDHNIRRIVVKASNPKGRSIIVSILCSDLTRNAEDIIALIFDRWIQENDFKYLDIHFGINEITSYANLGYDEVAKLVKDKMEKSGEYKALEKERINLKNRLKTQLLNEELSKKSSKKREENIATLKQALAEVESKIAGVEKTTSRLERLIEEGYRKLDTSNKFVMDVVKIMARNMFYECFHPFKSAYDNTRDDHVLFRHLTRSAGLIHEGEYQVKILLVPEAHYAPKLIGIIDTLLGEFNRSRYSLPDGSGRQVVIGLLQNNKALFEVIPTPECKPNEGELAGNIVDQSLRRIIEVEACENPS